VVPVTLAAFLIYVIIGLVALLVATLIDGG
jgi:hypothetical protein